MALPEYLNDIVKMLASWQLALWDDDHLFHKFSTHPVGGDSDVMAHCHLVAHYQYCWWKDWFDLLPFEMPDCVQLQDVMELTVEHFQQLPVGLLLLPDMHAHKADPDPLLSNLWVIKDDLEQLGTKLNYWLSAKMKDGSAALEAMATLEGPVDDLHDAMATAQELLDRGEDK
ncbi:uncharacterized protein F5891DRAFT_1197207 [Suillus fuscotomentosus]|uniref:Uncharacterized protein n=1 Tax=Suillus fuscotomentosus TaxID=1912939 RepID=A0AAD4DTE4_9AGAM|nr:uncharacterized protein F5891DRAFT_1197207 [Suillus fuscotomentosus]KAG1891919.1 hypothetical protein F5891DRAFT_1197207 [Suillus fuscotomentosus]